MEDLKNIGTFIAECRREKKLTQKALGEKLNVTDRAVSKWETGKSFPDVSILEALCMELDISISELFAGKHLEPERYREETEKMLVEAVGERQLYGFQIVILILTLAMVVFIYMPFLMDEGDNILPEINVPTLLCWGLAGAVAWCGYYINKRIPGRDIRHSSVLIGGIGAGVIYVFNLMFGCFMRNGSGAVPAWKDLSENLPVVLVFLICLGAVVLSGISAAVRQRREIEEWERYRHRENHPEK